MVLTKRPGWVKLGASPADVACSWYRGRGTYACPPTVQFHLRAHQVDRVTESLILGVGHTVPRVRRKAKGSLHPGLASLSYAQSAGAGSGDVRYCRIFHGVVPGFFLRSAWLVGVQVGGERSRQSPATRSQAEAAQVPARTRTAARRG